MKNFVRYLTKFTYFERAIGSDNVEALNGR